MATPFELTPHDRPGGGKSIIAFDAYLWADGADARRPLRVEVTGPLNDPNAAGLAHGTELGDLTALQEQLDRLMRRRAKARYAMRVTGEGKQTSIFYVAASLGLVRKRDPREALPKAITRFSESIGRELTVTFHDDPGWSRLLEIYSAHDPDQWSADRQMLIQMAKKSDAIHARRPVAHRVFFPDRDACRDFLRDIRKLKFKGEGGPKKAGSGDPGEFVLVVVRPEPTIATFHLHPVVLSVKAAASQRGGVYDGWEVELIPSLQPPPLMPPGRFG